MVKNKILFILKVPPPITGATVMNKRIFNSNKIRENFSSKFITVSYRKGISTSFIPLRKVLLFIWLNLNLIFQLIFYRPKLVYFQVSPLGIVFLRDFVSIILIKIFGIRSLIHIRVYGIAQRTQNNKFLKILYRIAFKGNYIACHSKNVGSDIESVYNGKPIVITNGMEDFIGHNITREVENVSNLLFLSNFLESKGLIDILEACNILQNNGFTFKLLLAGNYTDQFSKEQIENLIIKYELQKNTELIGPVYDKNKTELFKKSHVFVFPTKYEAFGNVAVEAMIASMPVIAYNEGSLPLIITHEETGYLVEKGNINQLARKIGLILKKPELGITLGENGRKKYLKEYTITKFETKITEVINNLLSEL